METWDRADILIAVLASGAILCLTTALIAVLGRCTGALLEIVDDTSGEPLLVRIVGGIIAGLLLCLLVGSTLLSFTLLWKVWTLP
ncbi:MAG TPA: hypothetical protein VJ553_00560 [Candidatus Paceibacterota bacterium]|nr:hypothetical protein [Candidatus Paceibacterota bacterium]